MKAFLMVCLLIAGVASAQAGQGGFLAAYEDLPLPDGLSEVAGSGLSFDTPAGRIVEAYARGTPSPAAILDFYAQTLPQLGWVKAGHNSFRRDDEMLRIETKAEGRSVLVHFTISPE